MAANKTTPSAPATKGAREHVPQRTHWRQILSGSRPREVLARLIAGDPLDVRRHVTALLRARSYLLDADRVYLRAVARCARFALRYRGQPGLETWLSERVEEALLDLLHEDLEAERRKELPGDVALAGLEDLARPLGLDPGRMRAVCVAFNHRPEPERRAFFALVIEGRSLDGLTRGEGSAAHVARRARLVLTAVLAVEGDPS